MNEYYVGITIGPIIETLKLASRPASLWCASAMFSWLSEDICNKAIDMGGKIISPYYPEDSKKEKREYSVTAAGVGKYHDRIIFKIFENDRESLKSKVDQMITQAKEALANELVTDEFVKTTGQSSEDLKNVIVNYLQVRFIITGVQGTCNCILSLSPYLDAAELCPSFNVDQSIQPIMTLFEGKSDDKHNELIKRCFGLKYGENSVVEKTTGENGETVHTVRDIKSIAESVAGSNRKIFDYYAIVQADGDSMGKLLENLNNDDAVETFSKICLDYTSKAAGMINKFGGMTIYAGGDDLLFISPLENKDGKNVFELCAEINKDFQDLFAETYENNIPTLSFGISINYKKFPLYEALNDVLNLLEEAKKAKKGEKKNKTALHIRKSSGQSAKFRFTNKGSIYDQLQYLLKHPTDNIILDSMLYKIGLYRPIIIASLSSGRDIQDLFKNLFDSEYHDSVKNYIDTVRIALEAVYEEIKSGSNKDFLIENLFGVHSNSEEESVKSDEELAIAVLFSMLRTARFFSEKRNQRGGK